MLETKNILSKIAMLNMLTFIWEETILCFAKCPVIIVAKMLAGVKVVNSFALCLFTVDVDVFLLWGLVKKFGVYFLTIWHIIFLEYSSSTIQIVRIISNAGTVSISVLIFRWLFFLLLLTVHIDKPPP